MIRTVVKEASLQLCIKIAICFTTSLLLHAIMYKLIFYLTSVFVLTALFALLIPVDVYAYVLRKTLTRL